MRAGRVSIPTTEAEWQIWSSAYGAAFAWHLLSGKLRDAKADYYARNVADRAVLASRDGMTADKRLV